LEKEMDLDTLQKKVAAWRSEKLTVCFTNGCFDILHLGHVSYLEKAAAQADIMIVGVNSDRSVRALDKAPNRPINAASARAKVIASLAAVDAVIVFDEDTPKELISKIVPNVLVKGGDYDPDETDAAHPKYIVGRNTVLKNGGRIHTVDLVDGFSTTSVIRKLKN
ncbi:MAG: adenylyltransferase/cytidyltransferase family protein, partial [Crocinitomicaceae bacterium]|nr:adenylyltransferase/cytidyltransferase family protein [Crocinitomicaceae bacterium]